MDISKKLNRLYRPYYCRIPAAARLGMLFAACAVLILLFQTSCSKKSKATPAITSPVRLVIVPFNVPAGNKDLRWAALAAPILMAKAGQQAQDLDIVPIWETMQTAMDNAGSARTFTQESAANVANWLAAKWCIFGELTPAKSGVTMVVDFIPSRSNLVAFRYLKTGRLDTVGAGFYDAYNQFLRYLLAKPLSQGRNEPTMTSMKDIAEALDREYGWFVEAEPGKAQETVLSLMKSDEKLARSLFSPTLYPLLASKK